MMLQAIIDGLDAAIAAKLSATVRHGLCELHKVQGGTMPVKHDGGGSFTPIASDTSGSFSYWRINGKLKEDATQLVGSCGDGFAAELPLRIVTLLDRATCPMVEDSARAAATDARIAISAIRSAIKAINVTLKATSIDAITESVYRAECGGAGFGMPGADKAMVAIDLTVTVTARASCFDPCDSPGDFTCRLIQSQQWARIRACLTESQEAAAVADLCDSCPCEPLALSINSTPFDSIEDPCGASKNVRVSNSEGASVGSPDGNTWLIPDTPVSRDGVPYASVPAGESIDVPSSCSPGNVAVKNSLGNTVDSGTVASGGSEGFDAPDATVQLKDSAGNNIGSADSYPSGTSSNKTAPDGTAVVKNLNGDTLVSAAIRSNASINVTAPIPLKFVWAQDDADTVEHTVTADEAGTYTAYTQDGSSGTITYNKNSGGFAALSGTIVLAVGDTIAVRRTVTTSQGFSRWAP